MSDDWPSAGIGAEPGSSSPGSSRSKPRPNTVLKRKWHEAVESISFGRAMETSVSQQRFNTDIKKIRERGMTDEQIAAGFVRFAQDVKVGRVQAEGKRLWSLFVWSWPKYCATPTRRVVRRQKKASASSWAALKEQRKK